MSGCLVIVIEYLFVGFGGMFFFRIFCKIKVFLVCFLGFLVDVLIGLNDNVLFI